MTKVHDIGFLKRVDRANGKSDLVDWSGKVIMTMDTERMPKFSKDLGIYRFRITEDRP